MNVIGRNHKIMKIEQKYKTIAPCTCLYAQSYGYYPSIGKCCIYAPDTWMESPTRKSMDSNCPPPDYRSVAVGPYAKGTTKVFS